MSDVKGLSIDEIINRASKSEFQVPLFQREFLWKTAQISSLAESAMQGLPCGCIVTWEDTHLPARPVRIPQGKKDFVDLPAFFNPQHPKRKLVIDGLQRITSICVAFAGLKTATAQYSLGGRFYIDMNNPEIAGSVRFKRDSEIKSGNFAHKETWLSTGLFPLSAENDYVNSELQNVWAAHLMNLTAIIGNANNTVWSKKLLLIQRSIQNTSIAEISIDSTFSLGDVSDNFELLNTAGTPVSAVDIVHSILYEWYKKNHSSDFDLREWIDDIHDDPRSMGWGRPERRQVIAQLVVSTELGLSAKEKEEPRNQHKQAHSVKNKDILGLSENHWYAIDQSKDRFKQAISDFQSCVLGAKFPEKDCPYPISCGIYVGLWWKLHQHQGTWKKYRMDEVFRAFFWSNVLSSRYDQGFLTQMAKDMNDIKDLLVQHEKSDDATWKTAANQWISQEVQQNLISKNELTDLLLLNAPTGALRLGLKLPIRYLPRKDILAVNQDVSFPSAPGTEVHHIFPKKWIDKNYTQNNFGPWFTNSDDKDQIKRIKNSLANLTPLIDQSNNTWSDSSPGTMILGFSKAKQAQGQDVWNDRFITGTTYTALAGDLPQTFLSNRASEVADWLINQTNI
ncbi:MAG: DUF262 domain-containing protein [Halioglobus sp.]